jgi:hypothetical protein
LEIVMLILTAAPFWVWFLLAALVALGLGSMRERTMPLAVVYLLPAIGLLTLPALMALPHANLAIVAHALAYAAGAGIGYRMQGRWLVAKSGRQVRLAGESFTLALMLTLFSAKFIHGTMTALAPMAVSALPYGVAFGGITGLAAGTFAGRALRTILAPTTMA